jgi:hypothetical protein
MSRDTLFQILNEALGHHMREREREREHTTGAVVIWEGIFLVAMLDLNRSPKLGATCSAQVPIASEQR